MSKTMRVKISLKGMNKAKRRVQQGIKDGLKTIGFNIERKARINAPRKTGRLKEMINSRRRGFTVEITADVNYAARMELPGNVRLEGIRPYMGPAFDEVIPHMVSLIAKAIKRRMK